MVPASIAIRPFQPDDARAASALIRRVFDEMVAPDFGPEGVAQMHAFIDPEALAGRATVLTTLVALDGPQIVGVIQMRDVAHVSLLFVHPLHMGQGIATALMNRVERICRAEGGAFMTVHSSLNAQGFYQRLRYQALGEPERLHGFVYAPMLKRL
jgi:GNAT superfamily N-acetyltransferase